MQDRVPIYPGRVKLVPVAGQDNTYDMTRADQPTQAGDPLNKATLWSDVTAALFGLGVDSVPDDGFAYLGKYAQHWWKRRTAEQNYYTFKQETEQELYAISTSSTSYNVGWTYGDSYTTDKNTGKVTIQNPTSKNATPYTSSKEAANSINQTLNGKYYQTSGGTQPAGNFVRKLLREITSSDLSYDSSRRRWLLSAGVSARITSTLVHVDAGEWEYVQSSDRSTYPDSGEQDGYEYEYLGIPFDNAITASTVETGSYKGTGTYGSSNPNSLTFGFVPKLVIIIPSYSDAYNSSRYLGIFVNGAEFPCTQFNGGGNGGSTSNPDVVTLTGWGTKTLSWYNVQYAKNQLNETNYTYYYIAIS